MNNQVNLASIIAAFENGLDAIRTDLLSQYKKSLYTYYKDLFRCEPVLMVTSVFNACSYAIIVPSNELGEAIETYLSADVTMTEEDREHERELISFQSIMLKDF